MNIHLNKFNNKTNWISGYLDDDYDIYAFTAKHFDERSEFGIDGGRVSKLSISTGNQGTIVNYDRGWDIRPCTEEDQLVCNAVVDYLENI